ncbi:restriction endonuclease subunit S [Rhizobium ruizarguesonis]|nr:restriction endonuclease subunit S [Rhizobium ruizarguesonis]
MTVQLSKVLSLDIDAVPVNPTASYKMAGVYSFGRGLFTRGPLSGAETTYKHFHRLTSGMVVLSQLKAWEGAIAIVGEEHVGCFLSTQFPTFKCNQDIACAEYIGWFLRYPSVWEQLRLEARGMGARRDTVSPEKFLSLKIPLPPLDEQKAIARQLGKVQAKLKEREAELAAVECDANAMLSNAFREITDGVEYLPLCEVAPLVRREIKIDPKAHYTEIGVRSFYKGIFHRRTMPGSEFSWQKLSRIHEGDLVFSNLMAWEEAIAVAGPNDAMCVGNHRMLTCAVKPGLAEPNFLFHYFQTPEGFGKILDSSPGSIARNKTLSSKKLPFITVPVPDVALQKRFARLRAYVDQVRAIRGSTARDVEALVPAMLHEIFDRRATEIKTASAISEATVVEFPSKQASIDAPFKEAVLVGAIVKAFHEDNGQPIGNFRLQKAVYFARRQMGESALDRDYLRKAAGPYNPKMRYSGGIKIATDKNWIQRATGKYGEGNALGDSAAEMDEWIERYHFNPVTAWVRDRFKYKSNDLWEALATIDYAMLALVHEGTRPTPAAILSYIDADDEWRPKIEKLRLTEASIQNVMVELEGLFVDTGG